MYPFKTSFQWIALESVYALIGTLSKHNLLMERQKLACKMQFQLLELAWVLEFFLAKKGLVTPKLCKHWFSKHLATLPCFKIQFKLLELQSGIQVTPLCYISFSLPMLFWNGFLVELSKFEANIQRKEKRRSSTTCQRYSFNWPKC